MSLFPVQVQLAQGTGESQAVNYQWTYERSGLKFEPLQITGHRWQYRAEGNSSLVLGLQNSLVVRLSKAKKDADAREDWTLEKRKIERGVLFTKHVFGPILGPDLVGSVRPVQLSHSDLKDLNGRLRSLRPTSRLHKELGIPYATYHTDFARIFGHSRNFCIEIKAKQGWWVNDGDVSLCTFCLNQFHKLHCGKIDRRSNYCPLDLFSGDPHRMIRSLMALLEDPQNNFRIFRDGVLVYGEGLCESLEPVLQEWISSGSVRSASPVQDNVNERNDLKNMLYLICLALLRPKGGCDLFDDLKRELEGILKCTIQLQAPKSTPPACGIDPARSLPSACVLSRILSAQKLATLSGGSIYKLFPKVCPVHYSVPEKADLTCPGQLCLAKEAWLDELEEELLQTTEDEFLSIKNYLLAATAKDCSIMITFCQESRLDSRPDLLKDLNDSSYRVNVGVADLDPKSLTSIARRYFRDLKTVQAYRTSQEDNLVPEK